MGTSAIVGFSLQKSGGETEITDREAIMGAISWGPSQFLGAGRQGPGAAGSIGTAGILATGRRMGMGGAGGATQGWRISRGGWPFHSPFDF